jgi:Protein of unknown function (DUF1570)
MKRCLIAVIALVVVNCGLASADYVLVKIDLNQVIQSANQPAPKVGGGFGQPGMPNPAGGGFAPGQGVPPQQFGGGVKSGKGGKGGGGGFPQQGFFPGGQQQGAGAAQPTGPQLPPLYVYAYLEVIKQKQAVNMANNVVPYNVFDLECKADGQKLDLWVREMDVKLFNAAPIARKFLDKFLTAKDGTDETKKKSLHFLAEWALQRGLLTDFNKCIDEIKKLSPKDPGVLAVEKTREELKKQPTDDDPAAATLKEDLRKEGYRQLASDQGHYSLMTNVKTQNISDAELKKKLSRLEEVYSAFFYWYALKGAARTPPPYRLVVVLVDVPPSLGVAAFDKKRSEFNFVTTVGGGFTAQRDNVLMLPERRLDDAFEKLVEYNRTKREEYDIEPGELRGNMTMLFGRKPKLMQAQQAGKPAVGILPVLQCLDVCQTAMNEESELHALSHGGIRQLISATGMMPSNVETAEWARFGLASFFEVSAQSFYPSTGGLNWSQLIEFKALRKAKVLDQKNAKDILVKTITDDYFRRANDTLKLAEQSGKEERAALKQKGQDELDLARATAWSLMHFLAGKKHKQLERYFEELRNLPRDLDYDSKVLRECFYRAFGLLQNDPNQPSRQVVDVAKLDSLSTDWFASMDKSQSDIPAYDVVAIQSRVDEIKAMRHSPATTNPLPSLGGQPGVAPQPGTLPPANPQQPPPGALQIPGKKGG